MLLEDKDPMMCVGTSHAKATSSSEKIEPIALAVLSCGCLKALVSK